MPVRTAVTSALLALCVASCASADPATVPPKLDTAQTPFTEEAMRVAHIELRTKECAAVERCDEVLFALTYGTQARCIGADASFGELSLAYGHGTAFTPANVRACAAALDLATCDAYLRYRYEDIVPAACRPLRFGTLADGRVCGAANQCASGTCLAPADAIPGACGRCIARRAVGAPCFSPDECEPGATCLGPSSDKTCRRLADAGERCDTGTACRHHLRCASGTCLRLDDDTCDPAFGCSAVPAFRHCSIATRTCVASIAGLDEPCGWLPDRGTVRCRQGLTCTRLRPSTPAPTETSPLYTCRPRLLPNSVCNAADHPFDSPCDTGVCYQQRCGQNAAPQCTSPEVPP